MDELLIIGVIFVGFISFARYDQVPPPSCYWCRRATLPENLRAWFKVESPKHFVFPPPRANTTPFKYWISRAGYTLVGIGIYLAILEIPGLAAEVHAIANAMLVQTENDKLAKTFSVLLDLGPISAAFVIAVLMPMLPPFKTADLYIRSLFYARASIPAQRFRELWRLKEADFSANPETLARVSSSLGAEGFDLADIGYDPLVPSTRSLWTKIAVLMRHCETWAGDDRYKSAFATLMDVDDHTLSFDKLQTGYEALKSDAKVCFEALKEPADEATAAREEVFRQASKTFLLHLYDFLSRVSLHSHYSEEERIRSMRAIGFALKDKESVPLPDANDLIMLVLVVAGVLIIPLAVVMSISKAIIIGAIVYSAILVPIYIASHFPKLAARTGMHGLPDLLFPSVAGLTAMLIGFVIIMTYRFFDQGMDLSLAWQVYSERYPWTFIHGTIACMIALRMRIGHYPDPSQLQGWQRYRAWGSLRDGVIMLLVAELVLNLLVLPRLAVHGVAPGNPLNSLIILGMLSFTIGFIVPTWYRARRALRQQDRRAPGLDRRKYEVEFREQLGVG